MTITSRRPRLDTKEVWFAGAAAAIIAAIVNAVIVILGNAVMGFNPLVQAVSPGAVVGFPLIAVVLATLIFWLLAQRLVRPFPMFRTIAVVVVLLSLLPDLWLLSQPVRFTGVGWSEVIALMLCQVVAFAITLTAFNRLASGGGRE